MGGRGPPYWMKCLMCLAKPSEKTQFFIGNCRCILCSSCASRSTEKCVACVRSGSKYQPIGPKLPSHIREMFSSTEESLIKVKAKQEFQDDLYNKLIKKTRVSIEKRIKEKKEIDKEMEILDAEIKAMQLKVAEIQEEIAKCDSAIKKIQDRKRQQKQNPCDTERQDSESTNLLIRGSQATVGQNPAQNQGGNKQTLKNFHSVRGLNETMASEFSLCSMLNKTVDVRNVGMFNIRSDADLLNTEEIDANSRLKQEKESAATDKQQKQSFQQPRNPTTSVDTNVISVGNKSNNNYSEQTEKEMAVKVGDTSRDRLLNADRKLNQQVTRNKQQTVDRIQDRSIERNDQKSDEKNLQRSLERKPADLKERGGKEDRNFFQYSKPKAQDLKKMRQTVQDQGQQQQMTAQPKKNVPGGGNLSDSEKKVNWQKQQQDMFNQKQSGQPQGRHNQPSYQNSHQNQGFQSPSSSRNYNHQGQAFSSQQGHAYPSQQGQAYLLQQGQQHPQMPYNDQKNHQYHPPGQLYRPQLGHQGQPYLLQREQPHYVTQPHSQQYQTMTRQQLQQFYDPQRISSPQQSQQHNYHQPNYNQSTNRQLNMELLLKNKQEEAVSMIGDKSLPPKVLFGPLNKKFKFKAKDTVQDELNR